MHGLRVNLLATNNEDAGGVTWVCPSATVDANFRAFSKELLSSAPAAS
jgi:hypothetical protein